MRPIIIMSLVLGLSITSLLGIMYDYGAVTLDNSGRREYGYCPINPETLLSRAQFEISGCPVVRVYISNWNQLTTLEQTTIDSQMRALGFKDISEFDIRVR